MSKMDGYASRTATDLERKYNFGQTFADVYGLVSDARKIAEEAQSAFEGLNQEQIFNLLTNFGEAQGIYRDDAGGVFINASYIKSGTISGDNVKVAAATVTGELSAATITADNISGGTLDFNNVTAKNLEVTMAQISDLSSLRITADVISGGTLDFDNIFVKNLEVDAANVNGSFSADRLNGGTIESIDITGSTITGSVFVARGNLYSGDTSSCFTVNDPGNRLIGYIGYSYERGDKMWISTLESDWSPAIKIAASGNISVEAGSEMVYISAPSEVQMDSPEIRIKDGTATWVFKDGGLYKDGTKML